MRRRGAALAGTVFAAALLPRVVGLGRFVTFDEPVWVYRTVAFWHAVSEGRMADTAVAAHPGVPTMLLGGLGIGIGRLVQPDVVDPAIRATRTLAGLRATDDAALAALAPLLFWATWPVAAAQAFGIALGFGLARRAFGLSIALAFALLLALDPFAIALARVLHVDGLQATWGAVAVLAAAAHARDPSPRLVGLSGAAAAVAALSKAPGAFAAAAAFLVVAAAGPFWRRRAGHAALWSTVALATALVLWPALWADPSATISGVLEGGGRYAERAVDTADFFLGQSVEAPGPSFYSIAWWFRVAPLVVLGLALAPIAWRSARGRERRAWLAAVGLAVGYVAVLSLSPKKFDRYLLPTWPAWALAAAVGYRAATRRRRWSARRTAAVGTALLAIQAALALPWHPYYLAWFSPLAGGLPVARTVVPVGWGEGLDQVADWARSTDGVSGSSAESVPIRSSISVPIPKPVLMTRAVPALAPLAPGRVVADERADLPLADFVVRYVADVQKPAPDWMDPVLASTPLFTATVRGEPHAWVYPNAVMAALARDAAVDTTSVISAWDDYLTRRAGAAVVPGGGDPRRADRSDLARALAQVSPRGEDVWLVRHVDRPTIVEAEAAFALDTAADRRDELAGPGVVMTRYAGARSVWSNGGVETVPSTIAGARFGPALRLSAAEGTAPTLSATRGFGLRLRWEGLTAVEADVTAFLHLTDAGGKTWGQVDRPIVADADAPHNADQPAADDPAMADVATQDLVLYARPEAAPGRYTVWLGVYRAGGGARLPVTGAAEATIEADRIRVGEVEVLGNG